MAIFNKLLLEETVGEKFSQSYDSLSPETLTLIAELDPTYAINTNRPGTYCKWMWEKVNKLAKVLGEDALLNDSKYNTLIKASGSYQPRLQRIVTAFDERRKPNSGWELPELPNGKDKTNINNYKSITDLETAVNNATYDPSTIRIRNRHNNSVDTQEDENELQEEPQGLDISAYTTNLSTPNNFNHRGIKHLFSGEGYDIYTPLNYSGSKILGGRTPQRDATEWCTANTGTDHWYKTYTAGGAKLYVLVNKATGERWQWYFGPPGDTNLETRCLNDERDYGLGDHEWGSMHTGSLDFAKNFLADKPNMREFFKQYGDTATVFKLGLTNDLHIDGYEINNGIVSKYIGADTAVTIPTSIKGLETSVFYGNKSVSRILVHKKMASISGFAFANCTNLKEVIIENGVKDIGIKLFQNDTALENVKWPNTFLNIPIRTFFNCTNLHSFEIPDGTTFIGEAAFRNSGLRSIRLPRSIEFIGDKAFAGCKELEEIIIPSISFIREGTFEGCSNLKRVFIPESVKQIRANAFKDCVNLEEVVNRSSAEINETAFANCPKLSNSTIENPEDGPNSEANESLKLKNKFKNCIQMKEGLSNMKLFLNEENEGTRRFAQRRADAERRRAEFELERDNAQSLYNAQATSWDEEKQKALDDAIKTLKRDVGIDDSKIAVTAAWRENNYYSGDVSGIIIEVKRIVPEAAHLRERLAVIYKFRWQIDPRGNVVQTRCSWEVTPFNQFVPPSDSNARALYEFRRSDLLEAYKLLNELEDYPWSQLLNKELKKADFINTPRPVRREFTPVLNVSADFEDTLNNNIYLRNNASTNKMCFKLLSKDNNYFKVVEIPNRELQTVGGMSALLDQSNRDARAYRTNYIKRYPIAQYNFYLRNNIQNGPDGAESNYSCEEY